MGSAFAGISMPLSPAARLSIEELAVPFGPERAHARQVADLALRLFDETHVVFGIPAEDRDALEGACLLHDAAYAEAPRRHAEAMAAAVLHRRMPGFGSAQRRLMASLIRLHPAGIAFATARTRARRQPQPRRALYAAALLRIADALDAARLQDVAIASVRVTTRRIRVNVRPGHFPGGLDSARAQAARWREAFPADLDLQAVRSGSPAPLLAAGMSIHEAARRLLALQDRVMRANVEGALRGAGDQPLHDLRIAIRRMRVVLRAFRKPLGLASAVRIDRDLQQLNRTLGLARDLDVWIGFFSNEAVSRQFTGHRLWAGFVRHQLELRRLQQATVRRQLHGARFRALAARIDRLLRVELPAAEAAGPPQPLAGPARRAVGKHLRMVLRHGDLRRSRSPEKLHRLRIALRRLRYLGGLLGEVLGRPVRKLGRRTHAIERVLGEMRDADLALARIRQEGPAPPRLLVRQLERLRRADTAVLEAAWNRLVEPAFILPLRRELKPEAPAGPADRPGRRRARAARTS
jgi:CHAD domain-containing protein